MKIIFVLYKVNKCISLVFFFGLEFEKIGFILCGATSFDHSRLHVAIKHAKKQHDIIVKKKFFFVEYSIIIMGIVGNRWLRVYHIMFKNLPVCSKYFEKPSRSIWL